MKMINKNWINKTTAFIISQFISMMGSSMVQYGIMWYLTIENKSGTMMALYVISGFLPHVFISPIAGILADRYEKKKIILLSDALVALTTLVLAIIFMLGYKPVWLFLLAAFIRAIGSGIQAPSSKAVIPDIVPKESLVKVGGIHSSIDSCMYILSPALGGLLLSQTDIIFVFFTDVVTALIGIFILLAINIPNVKRTNQTKNTWFDDIKQGVSYSVKNKYILILCIFYAMYCVFISPVSFLSPIYIERAFNATVTQLSIQEMVYSLGSIIGGLIFAGVTQKINKASSIALGTFFYGALVMLLALVGSINMFFVLTFAIGITLPFSSTTVSVTIQQKVDPDMMGRVFSVIAVVGAAASPLGMLIFGPLADIIDAKIIFTFCGFILIILSGWIFKQRKYYL